MDIISFNVNGIRAAINKGLYEFIEKENPEIVCLQETKAQPDQIDVFKWQELGYQCFVNSAQKRGYSGVAVFCKSEPIKILYNFDNHFDKEIFKDNFGNLLTEGRIITLELEKFFLINTYVPNVKNELERLGIRYNVWDRRLLEYIKILEQKKPVVLCGDMNVAHQEIDLTNWKANRGNAGFTDEEREGFSNFIAAGMVDVFRRFYPDKVQYTWWSMRLKARERNIGWRIDYFLCSSTFINSIEDIKILDDVQGSDHCPILLSIKRE
jgi:exodeoxyribonuclease-3